LSRSARRQLRRALVILAAGLAGCGAGTGEGLDENGQPLGSAPASVQLAPTLASIQSEVFTPRCAQSGCHGGAGTQQGLRLDEGFSAASLINVPSAQNPALIRLVPGDPSGSFVIHKLEGTQTIGDRMPQYGPYLSQSTIDVIRQWIQAGAPQ
jgi:hypothetical protein